MSLFLCLSCISLGQYWENWNKEKILSKKREGVKNDIKGEGGRGGDHIGGCLQNGVEPFYIL